MVAGADGSSSVIRARQATAGWVEANATEITSITGLDITGIEKEYEDLDIFGQEHMEHIFFRKKVEIRITKKMDNSINGVTMTWAILADIASHGIQDETAAAGAISDGTYPLVEQENTDSGFFGGYRVYIRINNPTTAADTVWITCQNVMCKYTLTPQIQTHDEDLMFLGNSYTITMATAPDVTDVTTF